MMTSLPQVARIREVVEESARVRTLVLDLCLPALPALAGRPGAGRPGAGRPGQAEPGQFVMAWLPGLDEKPFSLAWAHPVTLTVARVGPFSEALHRLRPGDRLWVRGPLGRPFTLPEATGTEPRGSVLMIAGGYGVAPLHFLAERACAAGWMVNVVIGARMAADVIYVGRFAALGVHVVVTTDDGSLGERGLATEAAARLLDEVSYETIYACGPQAMLDAVEALARARRVPAQLSYERYMRCGFGVCGSCVAERHGWLVCRDGPVLKIEP